MRAILALILKEMRRILLFISVLLLCSVAAMAQDRLAEQLPGRLFPYPMAPDTCTTLESRCNYIITHFWDGYDISKPISDEAVFEDTFRDFVDFFRFAHRNIVMNSVSDLMNKAQSNSSNLLKLGEVAERALYGTEAEFWSDEVYVAFIKPLASNKSLPKQVRERYASQLARINSVQVGAVLDFDLPKDALWPSTENITNAIRGIKEHNALTKKEIVEIEQIILYDLSKLLPLILQLLLNFLLILLFLHLIYLLFF